MNARASSSKSWILAISYHPFLVSSPVITDLQAFSVSTSPAIGRGRPHPRGPRSLSSHLYRTRYHSRARTIVLRSLILSVTRILARGMSPRRNTRELFSFLGCASGPVIGGYPTWSVLIDSSAYLVVFAGSHWPFATIFGLSPDSHSSIPLPALTLDNRHALSPCVYSLSSFFRLSCVRPGIQL